MKTPDVLAALAALAQERRLAIFRLLVQHAPEGLAAGTIAAKLDVSPPTLSFHLKELVHADLLEQRQQGRFLYYSANVGTMNALIGYLTDNCCVLGPCAPATCVPAIVTRAAPRRRTSPAR